MSKKNVNVEEKQNFVEVGTYDWQQYQILQSNIDFSSVDSKNRVIAITSAGQTEGKSTSAIDLSTVYAKRGFKTLYIDLDLRRPVGHRRFMIDNRNGITDYCNGNVTKTDIIKRSGVENLNIITCGSITPFPIKILESQKIKDLIQELRNEYDYIVIDTVPVLVATDVVYINDIVDGFVFIVKAGSTQKNDLRKAINYLKHSNVNIIGISFIQLKNDKSYKNYYYSNE